MKITAKFFQNTTFMYADPVTVDLSLSDADLFESLLNQMSSQWSSTGQQKHHRSMMIRDGMVIRNDSGRVWVGGNGWSVSIETEEYIQACGEAIRNKDWEKLASLTDRSSEWHVEE